MIRLIDDSSECNFLDNRCEWPIKSGAAICALMSIRPKHSDTFGEPCGSARRRSIRQTRRRMSGFTAAEMRPYCADPSQGL
jgi:hypothetical protein